MVMTHKEVESEVRRLCKENGIDFIFMTDEIASWSLDGNNDNGLVKTLDVIPDIEKAAKMING